MGHRSYVQILVMFTSDPVSGLVTEYTTIIYIVIEDLDPGGTGITVSERSDFWFVLLC